MILKEMGAWRDVKLQEQKQMTTYEQQVDSHILH